MKLKIIQIGNSLGVRIPKALLDNLNKKLGDLIEVKIE